MKNNLIKKKEIPVSQVELLWKVVGTKVSLIIREQELNGSGKFSFYKLRNLWKFVQFFSCIGKFLRNKICIKNFYCATQKKFAVKKLIFFFHHRWRQKYLGRFRKICWKKIRSESRLHIHRQAKVQQTNLWKNYSIK